MAQCISCDTHEGMFRGISVKFLENFPALRTLKLSPLGFDTLGTAVPVKVEHKFIYNLVTKPLHYTKPTITCLYFALHLMQEHATEKSVTNIAVPLLGSGCDKLDFSNQVFPMLKRVFGNTGINIVIYYFDLTPELDTLIVLHRGDLWCPPLGNCKLCSMGALSWLT